MIQFQYHDDAFDKRELVEVSLQLLVKWFLHLISSEFMRLHGELAHIWWRDTQITQLQLKLNQAGRKFFIFCRVSNGAWRRAEMVSQSESRNNALRMLFWCAMMLNLITKGPLRSISLQLMDDDSKSVKVRHRGSTNRAWKRFTHFSALFMYTHMQNRIYLNLLHNMSTSLAC